MAFTMHHVQASKAVNFTKHPFWWVNYVITGKFSHEINVERPDKSTSIMQAWAQKMQYNFTPNLVVLMPEKEKGKKAML